MTFELAQALASQSIWVADLPVSQCRLMNQSHFPWLLLIPRLPNAVEFTDLPFLTQTDILKEVNQAARVLQKIVPCDKLNIATLGNQVPQLHLHVIARTRGDQAWPSPVWGHPVKPYEAQALEALIGQLQSEFESMV